MTEPLLETELQQSNEPENIRPIHYLGSKLRFTEDILKAVDKVTPYDGRVCDLFAGSGTVSSALSKFRPVTAVDIQDYSRILCSSILTHSDLGGTELETLLLEVRSSPIAEKLLWSFEPLINYEKICIANALNGEANALAEILEQGSLVSYYQGLSNQRSMEYQKATQSSIERLSLTGLQDSINSTTSRYFGGLYFSFEQAVHLDSLLLYASMVKPENKDTITSATLSAASSIVNTVGNQFAQPLRPRDKDGKIKKSFVSKVERDRTVDTFSIFKVRLETLLAIPLSGFNHKSIKGDYLDVLSDIGPSLSCVYADPPYTRDHYSRYYHVLETMCQRDNPEISTVKKGSGTSVSRGVYRMDRHQSPFCIKSQAPSAFKALFETVRDLELPLVLSYSPHEKGDGTHPRVVSTKQLLDLAGKVFSHVELQEVSSASHSLLNSNKHKLTTRKDAEILITCHN